MSSDDFLRLAFPTRADELRAIGIKTLHNYPEFCTAEINKLTNEELNIVCERLEEVKKEARMKQADKLIQQLKTQEETYKIHRDLQVDYSDENKLFPRPSFQSDKLEEFITSLSEVELKQLSDKIHMILENNNSLKKRDDKND